jgi:hypothetical protein
MGLVRQSNEDNEDDKEEHAMILTKQELAVKALDAAEKVGVDPAIVCAIIESASGWDASLIEWNPTPWLLQQHPVDFGGDRFWLALGTRYGAMQVLGQDAYHAGYKTLAKLGDTDENLLAGCIVLKGIQGDEKQILALWFGQERRNLAAKALAILPQCRLFVEARPCVNT